MCARPASWSGGCRKIWAFVFWRAGAAGPQDAARVYAAAWRSHRALFTQVLGWARQAGMARLGRVAIDSTRIKANASPDRLRQQDARQVRQWRREMETEDPDQEPGLEVKAETAERLRRAMRREPGGEAKRKESLTDPDAACASGGEDFVWVTAAKSRSRRSLHRGVRVTQNATDNASLLPMIAEVERQCHAQRSKCWPTADFIAGIIWMHWRQKASMGMCRIRSGAGTEPGETGEGKSASASPGNAPHGRKLPVEGRQTCLHRKALVEPVIGVLKEQRGMRQFLRVGLAGVSTELLLAAISYNLTRGHRLLH